QAEDGIRERNVTGVQTCALPIYRAECLNHDPELFFPIGNTGPAITQIQEAKAVCQKCDVMTACLKFALESGQDSGVWGGLSEDERRSLKRRNARARRAG